MNVWHASLLVVTGCLSMAAALAQNGNRAERPDVKVGDSWTYKQTFVLGGEPAQPSTFLVIEVSGDRILTRTGPRTDAWTRDWGQTETARAGKVTFSAAPAWEHYRFPLEVGQGWTSSFKTVSHSGERHQDWEWTGKVEAVESVTTAAGTFEALRVRIDGSYRCTKGCNFSGTRAQTLWYAPAVKRHVKTEFEERSGGSHVHREAFELVGYKPAP